MNAMRVIFCVMLVGILASPGQGQAGAPPSSWKKTCLMGVQGDEGCIVKVEMRLDPNGPCHPGCPEFCVKIKVSCPPGIPAGDLGEECESEVCDICCSDVGEVSIVCDGQTFRVKPKPNKTWKDVADDCSNLIMG